MAKTNIRFRIFAALWIIVVLNFVDRTALSVSMPFIETDIHMSPAVQGWVLGSFFWTYLLFQIPGGYLLDRFGPRRVIGVSGSIWSLFQIAAGLVTSGILLAVGRLGLGASEAPTFPAGARLNANWLAPGERARGATFIDAAGPFGAAVGGLVVTGIIGLFGSWRWSFVVTGVVTILLTLAYTRYMRDHPTQHGSVSPGELAHIGGGADVPAATPAGALPRPGDYVRSPSFWAFMFGRLGWALVWWGLLSWVPSYLSNVMHFELASLGWGTFVVYGMGVVGDLAAGWLVDRIRRNASRYNPSMKGVLAVSGVGTALSIFSLPLISNGYLGLVALGLAVFFVNFGGLYWAIPAWLAPRSQVGTVAGVMNVASSGGGGLAPVVMGYAIAASGGQYTGAFVFLGVCAVLYLVGSMLIDFDRPLARAAGAGTQLGSRSEAAP